MGLLRIILAISVIAGHADTTVFGFTWVDEFYSVQAFFTISGFYMAMVLNETYATLPLRAFYRSRALRIFPSYWISILLMFALHRGAIKAVMAGLAPVAKLIFVVQNTVILGQDLSYLLCLRTTAGLCASPLTMTIDPPGWSLSVELGFYLIAPFVVRDVRRIVGFMAIGTLYLLLTNGVTLPVSNVAPFGDITEFPLRYYFYPSSFLFFGAGALGYHLRRLTVGRSYAALVIAVAVLWSVRTVLPPWHLMFLALAIPELFRLTRSNRLDRIVGEFSYPLYIVHWPILTYVEHRLPKDAWILTYLTTGTIATTATIAAAAALYVGVDRPISRIRHAAPSAESVGAGRETRRVPGAARWLGGLYLIMPFVALAAMVR